MTIRDLALELDYLPACEDEPGSKGASLPRYSRLPAREDEPPFLLVQPAPVTSPRGRALRHNRQALRHRSNGLRHGLHVHRRRRMQDRRGGGRGAESLPPCVARAERIRGRGGRRVPADRPQGRTEGRVLALHEAGPAGSEGTRSTIDRGLDTGLEPVQAGPLLPPIHTDDIELLCWTAINTRAWCAWPRCMALRRSSLMRGKRYSLTRRYSTIRLLPVSAIHRRSPATSAPSG